MLPSLSAVAKTPRNHLVNVKNAWDGVGWWISDFTGPCDFEDSGVLNSSSFSIGKYIIPSDPDGSPNSTELLILVGWLVGSLVGEGRLQIAQDAFAKKKQGIEATKHRCLTLYSRVLGSPNHQSWDPMILSSKLWCSFSVFCCWLFIGIPKPNRHPGRGPHLRYSRFFLQIEPITSFVS